MRSAVGICPLSRQNVESLFPVSRLYEAESCTPQSTLNTELKTEFRNILDRKEEGGKRVPKSSHLRRDDLGAQHVALAIPDRVAAFSAIPLKT